MFSQSKLEKPWYDSSDKGERNDIARTAYESVITITSRKPNSSQYQHFTEQVKEIARKGKGDDATLEDDQVQNLRNQSIQEYRSSIDYVSE